MEGAPVAKARRQQKFGECRQELTGQIEEEYGKATERRCRRGQCRVGCTAKLRSSYERGMTKSGDASPHCLLLFGMVVFTGGLASVLTLAMLFFLSLSKTVAAAVSGGGASYLPSLISHLLPPLGWWWRKRGITPMMARVCERIGCGGYIGQLQGFWRGRGSVTIVDFLASVPCTRGLNPRQQHGLLGYLG